VVLLKTNLRKKVCEMKRDTVILYQPKVDFLPYYPCFWAPLSILSVAAPLVQKGIRVIILDGNLGEHSKDRAIVAENISRCICVGITSMIGGHQLERGLDFATHVKSLSANLPIVFGGPGASIIPDQLITVPEIDFVVLGQGEKPFSDLVDNLIAGTNNNHISGVISKGTDDSKKVVPILLDKNLFPPYPWHLLNVEKYIREDRYLGRRVLNYVSSQGCPYSCGYCSEVAVYHFRWTAFTAKRTFEEVKHLAKTFSLEGIKFYDANFFVNSKRVTEFAGYLLNDGIGIKWGASAHPKNIIKLSDQLAEIKQSGLSRLLVGAESGSPEALKYIRKGCATEEILLVAELCARFQIAVAFTFIVGFPGIKEDIKATLDTVLEMKKISGDFDIKIHFYAPFPGTPLYHEARKNGYHAPASLRDWSIYDYYRIQTPWLAEKEEKKVRMFGDFYCDFLYPPSWFLDFISKKPLTRRVYAYLRKLAELRCRFHFYKVPLERMWFKMLIGKDAF